jgi:hypothetical protein
MSFGSELSLEPVNTIRTIIQHYVPTQIVLQFETKQLGLKWISERIKPDVQSAGWLDIDSHES